MVRRSSAVEQLTVNQLVVGSIPTAGAIFNKINMLDSAVNVKSHRTFTYRNVRFLRFFPNPESLSLCYSGFGVDFM